MTNGGSANFCPRESSIKVSQPLTKINDVLSL